MNRKKVLLVLFNAFVVVLLIWLVRQPGSRLVPLAMFCFVMAVSGFYYGFIKKDTPLFLSWRSRTQAAAVIFFMMALGLGLLARQESSGLEVISEWVTPYPNINKIMLVPSLSKEYVWGWILESPDQLDKIVAFYKDTQNTRDWEVSYTPRVLIMRKKGYELVLMVRDLPSGSGLYYQLKSDNTE